MADQCRSRLPFIGVSVALVVASIVTFLPVLSAELVHWDDDINIFANPHIQKLDWEHLRWMFTDVQYTPRYRPLNWLAWATLLHFFGLSGPAFHWYLVILHAANAFLVFTLVHRIIGARSRDGIGVWTTSVIAGPATAAWALHPLRVEVVGWANCVIYTQSLFFLLLSAVLYFRAVEQRKSSLKSPLFWISVLLFMCSLLTYPTALGWVVVLIVLDTFLLRRFSSGGVSNPQNRRVLLEKIPFAAAALAVAAVNIFARSHTSGIWSGIASTEQFGWASRAAQAFYVWCYYIWKPWLPFGLSPVYTRLVSFQPTEAVFLISCFAVIAVTVIAFVKRSAWPLLSALWFCHLVLLIPMLGLTEHPHYTNDRYSYIVGILWPIAIAMLLVRFAADRRRFIVGTVGCVVVIAMFAPMSFKQSQIWHNSETLFRSAIARLGADPYRCDLHWRLGLLFANDNKNDAAVEEFSQALTINPNMWRARSDLAGVLARQNKLNEAALQYGEVLRATPKNPEANYNLGIVLTQQGHPDQASDFFSRAVSIQPANADAQFQFGRTLAMTGKMKDAALHFREASRLKPDFVPALVSLSMAHEELHEWNEALDASRRALSKAGNDKELARQIEEKISSYERSIQQSSP